MAYINKMVEHKVLLPHLYLEHVLYDETPLELCIQYAGDTKPDREVSKCFSVEASWAMLLQFSHAYRAEDYVVIKGRKSAKVRAAGAATGEAIFKVLEAADAITDQEVTKVFPRCTRVVETDENPANARAESFVVQSRKETWSELRSPCLAHKIHSCATKSFPLHQTTIRGAVHTQKHLKTAGAMTRLKSAVATLAAARLEILVHNVADRKAIAFKESIMKWFCPSEAHPRRRALMLSIAEFFNGNWLTRGTLQHQCPGLTCCASREGSIQTAQSLLTRMISALHIGVMSKANWQQWSDTLAFFAFGDALHGVVVTAFQTAFAKEESTLAQPLALEGAGLEEDAVLHIDLSDGVDQILGQMGSRYEEDPLARQRAEHAISLGVALRYMVPGVWKGVYSLKVTLAGEKELMSKFLHNISLSWDLEQLHSQMHHQQRQYRVLNVYEGACFDKLMQAATICLEDQAMWEHFSETEQMRSQVWQRSLRPAAICHQLLVMRCAGLPYRMFSLLKPGARRQEEAAAISELPHCLRDQWSRSFLSKFSTHGLLQTPAALHELHLLAETMLLVTYSTERLHSKHLRRAKDKQGQKPDLKYLGLSHLGWSAPPGCVRPARIVAIGFWQARLVGPFLKEMSLKIRFLWKEKIFNSLCFLEDPVVGSKLFVSES